MPIKTTTSNDSSPRKKSFLGSLTDRCTSRKSLVYNVGEAERLSDTSSMSPVEEKLDRLSDDLHSLQNTLQAVAHRVFDLEKMLADKKVAEDYDQDAGTSSQQVVTAQMHRQRSLSGSVGVRKRKSTKHDINHNGIQSDQQKPILTPSPPSVIQSDNTKKTSKRPKYDLESVLKHELYRTVPKIIVDSCNLIEDHATIAPFDRVYFLTGNWDEVQLVLDNYLSETNYDESLNNVKSMHTLATIVKVFIQDLRYPVISMSEIQAFLGTNKARWEAASTGEKVDAMQKLMKSLPETNRDTVKFFIRHLKRLCRDYPAKVRSSELAINIAPCLFQLFRKKSKTSQEDLRDDYLITYLQFMITHCDSIFKINQRTKFRKTLERCISCPGLFNM